MKRLILITYFLLGVKLITAQSNTITRDSLEKIITPIVKKEVEAELKNIWLFTGITISGLTILGVYLWIWRIKKIAEEAITKKADKIIEDQISQKLGVKSELIQAYFKEIEQAQKLKQKRILVVNKDAGKRLSIEKVITNAGFLTVPIFKKWAEIAGGIDTNQFDLLLFDNEDGNLNETEIIKLVNDYGEALKFACFTGVDVTPESYRLLSSKVRFAKDINYLAQAIENALKS